MSQSTFENAQNLARQIQNLDPLAHIKEFGEPDFFDREAKREVDSIISGRLLLDEDGYTAGMARCSADPILRALDNFRDVYNTAVHDVQIAKENIKEELDYEAEKSKIQEAGRSNQNANEQRIKGSDSFKRIEDDYKLASQHYNRMKEENGGREPGKFPASLYILGLFFIGLAEWFINYSTFRDTYVPLVAGASTFLIACIFAAASHWHGIFFKQNVRLFARTRPSRDRISDIIWLSFATIAMIAVFTYIGWMRYSFIADQMGGTNLGAVDLLSEDSGGMDPVLSKTLQTIGLNAFVWCVGIFISYFFHDAVPGFKEARNHYWSLQKKRDSSNKPLKRDTEVVEETVNQNLSALEGRVSAQTERLREIRNLEKKIETKAKTVMQRAHNDIETSAKRYKNCLSEHLLRSGGDDVEIGVERISIDKFVAQESTYPVEKIEQRLKPVTAI